MYFFVDTKILHDVPIQGMNFWNLAHRFFLPSSWGPEWSSYTGLSGGIPADTRSTTRASI